MTTTALVTGAGGFIGGHLVKSLLQQGCAVLAVDRKPVGDWHQLHADAENCDKLLVRNMPALDVWHADEVYHLAADMGGIGYITNHLVSCSENIVDTIHLLNLVQPGQRIFFSSSACVYPVHVQSHGGNVSLKERDVWPYDPEPGYGFEKLYGEQLMHWHAQERDITTRVARFHNVYGPHGDWDGGREKAPAALCRKIAIAKLLGEHTIDVWGDGEAVRSFMYVDDCVKGTQLIMRSAWDQPLNLGSSEWVTVNELAATIAKIAGISDLKIEHVEGPQGVRGRNSDNTLLRSILAGWEPNTSLRRGLELTYKWIYDQCLEQLRITKRETV